ncbi:hypothetical protein PQQ64_07930 [Paraburkholderia graminis]|jgi:hypothetical protein|uniref:hypothetical protein n=1 Tax=Paraburkholderia graminis TaxID=60548 RepID=UPI0038B95A52
MYVHYDYRYVIACSTMRREMRREFRNLVRGKVRVTCDRRTQTVTPVSAEGQCRRIAELLEGFEALRSSGFALQSPWNFKTKHLRFLIDRWSTQQMTREERAEQYEHWCQFLLWIRKQQLISLLNDSMRTLNSTGTNGSRPGMHAVAYARPVIPILTREKIMEVLDDQRGSLTRAACALRTSTRFIYEVLGEGQPPEKQLPPGLTILTAGTVLTAD